jgi:hypothetical protein
MLPHLVRTCVPELSFSFFLGLPAEDQNDMGWASRVTRRNAFYGWNTINKNSATTIAGTPYGSRIEHQSPFNLIQVPDSILSALYDPPLKWRQKWLESGPPKKSCCVAFNALIIMLFQTFIQALPIIFRMHGKSIDDNPEHVLNHESVKRIMASGEYKDFAAAQLIAYDAAIERPLSQDQATLDALTHTTSAIHTKVDSLITISAMGQQKQSEHHESAKEKLSEIVQILKEIRFDQTGGNTLSRAPALEPGFGIQGAVAAVSTTTHATSVDISAPVAAAAPRHTGHRAHGTAANRATGQSFPRTVSMDDLLEYRNAVHYFRSLDILDKQDVAGIRHGCEELVRAVQCGLKQADGISQYPSLLEMDSAKGKQWTNQVKCPADWDGPKPSIRGIAAKYRGIHEYVEAQVPFGAVGSRLDKAIRSAQILDKSREKGFSLSAWWDKHTTNMAQVKKAKDLREIVLSSKVLDSEEKVIVTNLLNCVDTLAEEEPTSAQLKEDKKKGSRALHPTVTAFKKAENKYKDFMQSKLQPADNTDMVPESSAVSTPGRTLCSGILVCKDFSILTLAVYRSRSTSIHRSSGLSRCSWY